MCTKKSKQLIQIYGYENLKREYLIPWNRTKFCRKYNITYETGAIMFGKEFTRPQYDWPNIRDGINQVRWEVKNETPYWEKPWFEVVEQKYLQTNLL